MFARNEMMRLVEGGLEFQPVYPDICDMHAVLRQYQISAGIKKELDAKLQDFSIPQDNLEETFENKEQIEISRQYERLPKPSLMATQEFIDGELVYRSGNRDEALK